MKLIVKYTFYNYLIYRIIIGEKEMSLADEIFIKNCTDILENGYLDSDLDVRPKWEDGTPAHTIKKFGVVNRYDLSKEFPILTLRRTYLKSAIKEILWIWQKKSNNINDLDNLIDKLKKIKGIESVVRTEL